MSLRVAVMGAGGVGGYFGARLARGGETVVFIARGPHLEAIRRQGLTIRSTAEGEYVVKAEAVEDPAGLGPVDAVLFCVKSFDTESAAERIRPLVGTGTAVLSLQNGVDNEEKIDAHLGPGRAMGGVAQVFAGIEGPGVIAHRLLGRIIFGELDGTVTERARALGAAFARAGIPAELSTDIRGALWEKYISICAQAGMTALTRAPVGVVRAVPETWRMFRMLAEEVTALGTAGGVRLPADMVERVMAWGGSLAPEARASLANDLIAGRRLELEALHGYAVRLAERLGVPVPSVFAVYAALKPHAAGRAG